MVSRITLIVMAFLTLTLGCKSGPERADSGPTSRESASGDFDGVSEEPADGEQDDASREADESAEREMKSPRKFNDVPVAAFDQAEFKRAVDRSFVAESDVEPNLTVTEVEQVNRILTMMQAESTIEAFETIRENIGPDKNAMFDFLMGHLYLETEQYDKALPHYKASVAKFPKFLRAWRMIAEIHVRRGELDLALEPFTQQIRLGAADAFTYGRLGIAYSAVGEYVAAESAFRHANLLDPKKLDWKLGMADSLLRQGRLNEATSLFDNLIRIQPDRADLWLAQGEAYAELGNYDKAAENFEIVERLGGSTSRSLNNLADIYNEKKLYGPATDAYLRALMIDEKVKPTRALRAAQFMNRFGASGEQVRTLLAGVQQHRGAALSQSEKRVIFDLEARVAVAEGKGADQAAALAKIVALDPTDGDALIRLGQYYRKNDKPQDAAKYYEKAKLLTKYEADACFRHAELLVSQRKYQEALPLLRRSLSINDREVVRGFYEKVEIASKRNRSAGG